MESDFIYSFYYILYLKSPIDLRRGEIYMMHDCRQGRVYRDTGIIIYMGTLPCQEAV